MANVTPWEYVANDVFSALAVSPAPARDEIDETKLAEVIDVAQRRWGGSGRHEPIADAITRAVIDHLRGSLVA